MSRPPASTGDSGSESRCRGSARGQSISAGFSGYAPSGRPGGVPAKDARQSVEGHGWSGSAVQRGVASGRPATVSRGRRTGEFSRSTRSGARAVRVPAAARLRIPVPERRGASSRRPPDMLVGSLALRNLAALANLDGQFSLSRSEKDGALPFRRLTPEAGK